MRWCSRLPPVRGRLLGVFLEGALERQPRIRGRQEGGRLVDRCNKIGMSWCRSVLWRVSF